MRPAEGGQIGHVPPDASGGPARHLRGPGVAPQADAVAQLPTRPGICRFRRRVGGCATPAARNLGITLGGVTAPGIGPGIRRAEQRAARGHLPPRRCALRKRDPFGRAGLRGLRSLKCAHDEEVGGWWRTSLGCGACRVRPRGARGRSSRELCRAFGPVGRHNSRLDPGSPGSAIESGLMPNAGRKDRPPAPVLSIAGRADAPESSGHHWSSQRAFGVQWGPLDLWGPSIRVARSGRAGRACFIPVG